VHLFLVSGQILTQSPSQFYSTNEVPDPSRKEHVVLSALDLDEPSSTMLDVNITPANLGTTSRTDPDAFSAMGYDLNKTTEENEDILSKRKKMKVT